MLSQRQAPPQPKTSSNQILSETIDVGQFDDGSEWSCLLGHRQEHPNPLFMHPVQTKMLLSGANDTDEQEADRVATQVADLLPVFPLTNSGRSPIQPQAHMSAEQEEMRQRQPEFRLLQRQSVPPSDADGEIPPELASSIDQAKHGGHSLPNHLQAPMEASLSANLNRVRLHTDTRSDQLNRKLQSRAFTTGADIFFRQGEYQPNRRSGQELIFHELTHTVQQQKMAIPHHQARVQCVRLKGRRLELETTDISKDHIPESVRVNLAAAIEILEHAGHGQLWDAATETWKADPAWQGSHAKAQRQNSKKKLKILQSYQEQEVPKSKIPEESESHASAVEPESMRAEGATAAPQSTDTPEDQPLISFLRDYGAFETDFAKKIAKVRGLLKSWHVESLPDAHSSEDVACDMVVHQQITKGLYEQDSTLAQFLSAQGKRQPVFKRDDVGILEEVTELPEKVEVLLTTGFGTNIRMLSASIRASRQDIPFHYHQVLSRWKALRAEQYISTFNAVCRQAIQYMEKAAEETVPHVAQGEKRLERYKADWKSERKQTAHHLTTDDPIQREQQAEKKAIKDDWAQYVTRTAQVKQEHLAIKRDLEKMYAASVRHLPDVTAVLTQTQGAMGQYTEALKGGKGVLAYANGQWAALQAWSQSVSVEQQQLGQWKASQDKLSALRHEMTARIEGRKVAHAPTLDQLHLLQKDIQAAWSNLMHQSVGLEEIETKLSELEQRFAQESSEFEALLNSRQRLDRSELADEETRITEIHDWASQQQTHYLPEARELRILFGNLVGDRHPGTIRTKDDLYLDAQEWQQIHPRLQALQTTHQKVFQDFKTQQQRDAVTEDSPQIEPLEHRRTSYNRLDASTWVATPGGVEYLNGLTPPEVEQADPATVPKLLAQLEQLTLYGQHQLNPVVGRVYHRHILGGRGGLAFTYRLDPDTYRVTPCVVDIATQRPSRESSNKYYWQQTKVFDYNPPLPKSSSAPMTKEASLS